METSALPFSFLRAFFNELAGRYAHLELFADRSAREARDKNANLLTGFSDRIRERQVELFSWSQGLVTPPTQAKLHHLSEILAYLLSESSIFQSLHRKLRWFAAPWPESEVLQFLVELSNEYGLARNLARLHPTIVYSDEFNFFTSDVSRDLPRSRSSSPLVVLAIPKSDSGNPLLWSVLAHELAHSLFKEEDLLPTEVYTKLASQSKAKLDVLRSWTVELNADLFAFRLLGPAYLYALIYFSVFFVLRNLREPIEPDPRDSTGPHPPPQVRVDFLLNESTHLDVLPAHLEGVKNTYRYFRGLYDARLKLDKALHEFQVGDYTRLLLNETTASDLCESISSTQRQTFSSVEHRRIADFEAIEYLSRRLTDRQLASSVSNYQNLVDVRKYVKGISKTRSPSDESTASVGRERVLSGLDERPARMTEVVNAGWVAKSLNGCLPLYGPANIASQDLTDLFVEPARQLQKSVQVALILSSLSSNAPVSSHEVQKC